MKKIFQTLIFGPLFAISAHGQQIISSSGGSFTNSNIIMEFTIGEIITETYSNNKTTLTQGFHQSILSSTPTSNLMAMKKSLGTARVFPNPIKERFTLEITENDVTNKSYEITNIHGTVIQSGSLESGKTELSLTSSSQGIYLLSFRSDQQLIQTIKLIKQ